MGVMAIVIGLTFYLTASQRDLRQRASGTTTTEYGFNTHLNTTGGNGYWENLTLDFFKNTVDDLVANKQQWIRFNIAPWESSTGGNASQISWNETAMQKYDEAIQYAKSKGLKIYLVTATPDFANSFPPNDYTSTTIKYHTDLANRYKDKITIWQIFNEADVHNFKGYALLDSSALTSAYLTDFKTNFVAAKNAIRSIDPNVQFASNVTGYPLGTSTYDRWNTFFDVIAPELDILALDIYPRGTSDISLVKSASIGIASKYLKPIIIAETGFPTNAGTFSETDQVNLLSQTVEQLRASMPIAILYYQYADTLPTTDKTESSFGIVKADGTKKTSYSSVMQTMANPTGLLRVEANPAVGATITVTSVSTNQIVLTKEWAVDWEKLPVGDYKVVFSNPNNLKIYDKEVILPQETTIAILPNQTTTIVANLTTGTASVSPEQGTYSATPTPAIPTSTPVPPTPTPTQKVTTGLLRVTTNPPTAATIKILKRNGQVVMTRQWGIDWEPLAPNTYYIQFSYPKTAGFITPRTTSFRIYTGKTTEIIGNFSTGKTSVTYH